MSLHRAALPLAIVPLTGVAFLLVPFLMLGAATASPTGPWISCAGGGTGQTIDGTTLDAEQVGNAQTVVTVTADKALPADAATIAIATAMQESGLRNLDHGDRDSLGLFQQRVSIYGADVATDPVRATTGFLDRLVRVPGWQVIPLTQAAQAVQRSAFPDAYSRWQPLAESLTGRLWPAAAAAAADGQPGTGPAATCPRQGPPSSAGTGNPIGGTTTLPAGLVIDGSAAARKVVRYALAQLGKPYRWGAAGPDAYDCSGLTMAAWANGGIALPHHAADQATHGAPEPTNLTQAHAGDLVFIPGADGTPQHPGHVGMIVGRASGHLYLIQAPNDGIPVEITDTINWTGFIVAVRHVG